MLFRSAPSDALRSFVFHSIIGEDWYRRLRGWEADDIKTKLGVIGRQFVMDKRTNDEAVILPRLHYLCQTTGMKLRFNRVDARGVLVWAGFANGESWYQRKMFKTSFYTDQEIYRRALLLFNNRPKHMKVASLGITCYQLNPSARSQVSLLDTLNKAEWITEAVDTINDRYGTFTVTYANALEGKKVVKQKIP